jgi:hypothetical protein
MNWFSLALTGLLLLPQNAVEWRRMYLEAVKTESAATQLEQQTRSWQGKEVLMQAYQGVALALKAKYSYNPYTKVSAVKEGSVLLNAAVNRAAADTEIRFLRYSVEVNTPSMVGISTHLASDKAHILAFPPLRTHTLFSTIQGFMLSQQGLSEAEKHKVRAWK